MKVLCGVAAHGSGSKLNKALSPHPIPGAGRLQSFSCKLWVFLFDSSLHCNASPKKKRMNLLPASGVKGPHILPLVYNMHLILITISLLLCDFLMWLGNFLRELFP